MSDKKSSSSSSGSNEGDIFEPINIARARHASNYNPSVASRAYQAFTSSQSAQQASKLASKSNELGNCLLFTLLATVFVGGSILGGIIGGGLINLFVSGGNGPILGAASTPTSQPTPTPAPAATLTPTPTPEQVVKQPIEDTLVEIMRSVVTVINKQEHYDSQYSLDEGRVVGSGVIIDSRGYIATNNHVVKNPGHLSVVLSDGRELEANLIAFKADRDLAVLKVSLINLPTIRWADSTKIRPGQVVYAVGSPLGDFPNSVSFGIISGLNRALEMDGYVIDSLIQTDAAINRGSSGGPLINTDGEVIGINTFIIRESEERGIAEGIAFAIPADAARTILNQWVDAHSAESEVIPVGN